MTSASLYCYRCGADLAALTPPLSRRDTCPSCRVDLHVCLMCTAYDPSLPGQCAEEAAADVHEKARANFCDYFKPNASAYVPGRMTAERRAQGELEALFGDAPAADRSQAATGDDAALHDAEALFKR